MDYECSTVSEISISSKLCAFNNFQWLGREANPRHADFQSLSLAFPRRRLHCAGSPLPQSPPKSSPFRRAPALAAVATTLGLAASTPAQAQRPTTFPTDNPAIKRIWQIGMDSSRVEALGQALLDSIGPRLTGSPGMTSASDWAIAQYKAWGIDAKHENHGTWRGWRRGVSHIDLVAPRTRSLEGTMLAWSPGTMGKPVKAEAIVLPKFRGSTDFVAWLPKARGTQ
jgi:hypothetical protein